MSLERTRSAAGSLLPRVDDLDPTASAHLDFLRAFAAWAVMWGHLRAIFFVDYAHLRHRGPAVLSIYFFTGFGHQAVMVFFVLSGFLISGTIIKRYSLEQWSWRDYAMDRGTRLYIVLLPGLFWGFLWDKWGYSISAPWGLYSQPLTSFGNMIPLRQVTLRIFLGNLFFLQTMFVPTFGSNGPLWSLANEFWYYVLFPLAFFAVLAWCGGAKRWAIALGVAAAGVAGFVGREILAGFAIWLTGWGLLLVYSRVRFARKSSLAIYSMASLMVLSACLIAARVGHHPALGSDLSVGLAFALALFGILQIRFRRPHLAYSRTAHFFAGFSYSLYVLHFPFLLFLRAWITPAHRWEPDAVHFVYALAPGAVTLAFAWLVSLITENKTRTLRRFLRPLVIPAPFSQRASPFQG